MTGSHAPTLLAHDASSRLGAALRRAQAQGPSEHELQAMFEAVGRSIAASEPVLAPYSGSPRTWPPVAVVRWRPWIIGAGVALLAGFGGFMLARKHAEPGGGAARAASALDWKAKESEPAVHDVATSARVLSQAVEQAPSEVGPATPPAAEALEPEPRARRSRPAIRRAEPIAPAPDAWLDQSAEENALLEPAVRELRAQRFTSAIEHATEHELRFPQGALSQTREMLLIEALLMLDRRSEALARAALFRERYPDSLYREKLDTLLLER